LTPNELVVSFVGFYVCANFGENRSRYATVRVLTDGQVDTQTDANRFYNLSHAICYSYGTDNNGRILFRHFKAQEACDVIVIISIVLAQMMIMMMMMMCSVISNSKDQHGC